MASMLSFHAVEWCEDCRVDHPRGRHFPLWAVWNEEDSQARRVHAIDAGAAAEEWADRDDTESAEYGIIRGQPATVLVQSVVDGEAMGVVRRFVVSGESVPKYTARCVP